MSDYYDDEDDDLDAEDAGNITNRTDDQEKIACIPFDTSLMSKDDMEDHMSNVHGISLYYQVGSRWTKDQAVVLHMRHHDEEREPANRRRYYNEPTVAHNHTASPEPTEAQRQAVERASNPLGKALNSSERKALNDLVNNDFAVLRNEIEQFANDMLQQRLAEIETEYADKEDDLRRVRDAAIAIQTEYREAKQRLLQDYTKKAADLGDEAKLNGIGLSFNLDSGYGAPSLELQGKKDAIAKAKAEVEADRARARNTLERQRLSNQRKVLMLGVSQDGLDVLDTMPDARQLMVEAAQQRPVTAELNA